jgi:hypothetical protein
VIFREATNIITQCISPSAAYPVHVKEVVTRDYLVPVLLKVNDEGLDESETFGDFANKSNLGREAWTRNNPR